jgi:aminoglycoside/choline kinase family phosphotransferase
MATPDPSPSRPAATIGWPDAHREAAFHAWLAPLCERFSLDVATLAPASADASFRRYFRLSGAQRSLIVMDAPPPQEDVRPFVDVAQRIHQAGLHAPEVLAADPDHGFILLTDLGQRLYLDELQRADSPQADALMRDAVNALLQWQQGVDATGLPDYDSALLQRELSLFETWCVTEEYGLHWSATQQQQWQRICELLIDSALAQPQLAVHRDWMPRNLMVTDPNPGILDFQDAVRGPITYDVASLLRDAFLSWEEDREIDWAVRWWKQARDRGLLADHAMEADFGECWRALEWMGLQRHLKVLGIFCRLKHRDGKPHYAEDLPRFFAYATKVALRYRPLAPLLGLLEPLSGQRVGTGLTF